MKKLLVAVMLVASFIFVFSSENVLFDNAHAQTAGSAHWTIDTGFSYFADDVEDAGFRVNSIDYGEIKASLLEQFDILVIPEPNNPFDREEIEDIKDFVKNGGGLFLISDHKGADRNHNGWDSIKIYNKFVDDFGFKFNERTFSEHPLKGDRLDCSVMEGVFEVGSWGGTSIEVLDPSKVKGLINVSNSNGGDPFVVVAEYGKGRIVAVGDSSPFDDGSMSSEKLYANYQMYDHRNMAVNLVDFLAKKNGFDIFK